MTIEREKIHIWDIPIDRVDRTQAMAIFDELIAKPGVSMIVTPNSEIIMNASKDEDLADLIREAELV
ncbi:MAG: glycosyltransferase, partial [Firmicutes bacterium]|nr:glycosyltransferase [Bacillota bacterium]